MHVPNNEKSVGVHMKMRILGYANRPIVKHMRHELDLVNNLFVRIKMFMDSERKSSLIQEALSTGRKYM
jgi:hypothetical protein